MLCYGSADHAVCVCLVKVSKITHGWAVKEGEPNRQLAAIARPRLASLSAMSDKYDSNAWSGLD